MFSEVSLTMIDSQVRLGETSEDLVNVQLKLKQLGLLKSAMALPSLLTRGMAKVAVIILHLPLV